MKNKMFLVAALLLGSVAQATTVTINIDPSHVPDGQSPFVYNEAPTPGLGPDSWQNNNGPGTAPNDKVNWHARYLADGDFLTALFGAQAATMTVNDIASLSYWTKRPDGTVATQDWSLFIYTRPDGVDDGAGWYGYRFVNDYNTHTNIGDWTQYSTASGMTFNENSAASPNNNTEYSLAQLQASYGNELVEMISVQTFSNYTNFNGYMDGLTITLANGDVGIVNFGAPVPEPATMTLLGLGLAGLGLRARKRKRA